MKRFVLAALILAASVPAHAVMWMNGYGIDFSKNSTPCGDPTEVGPCVNYITMYGPAGEKQFPYFASSITMDDTFTPESCQVRINKWGTVVGGANIVHEYDVFSLSYWDPDLAFRYLGGVMYWEPEAQPYVSEGGNDWIFTSIDDDGYIRGFETYTGGPISHLVGNFRPVPEPATFGLVGLGLLGIAVRKRRVH